MDNVNNVDIDINGIDIEDHEVVVGLRRRLGAVENQLGSERERASRLEVDLNDALKDARDARDGRARAGVGDMSREAGNAGTWYGTMLRVKPLLAPLLVVCGGVREQPCNADMRCSTYGVVRTCTSMLIHVSLLSSPLLFPLSTLFSPPLSPPFSPLSPPLLSPRSTRGARLLRQRRWWRRSYCR